MAFVRALLIKVEIYWDMKGSHLTFLYNFKVKSVFSAPLLTTHTSNNLHSIMYNENNVQSPINIPNHCTI